MPGARAHLAGIEDGLDALCPEAVRPPVPREPPVLRRVEDGRRIAIERGQPLGARAAVGPGPRGIVTARAGHGAADRQAAVEEEPLAERDRRGIARRAVARIPRGRWRPGAVLQDAAQLTRREVGLLGRRRRAGQEREEEGSGHARDPPRGRCGGASGSFEVDVRREPLHPTAALHAKEELLASSRQRGRISGIRAKASVGTAIAL